MICSVLNCPYSKEGNGRPEELTFYGFPTEKEVYDCWVTATGKPNFFPNLNSKICSIHFDSNAFFKSSGKLKKSAIPTLNLKTSDIAEPKEEDPKISYSTNDPISCILDPNAKINKVELLHETVESMQSSSVPRSLVLSQTTHKIVNIVSSCNELFHTYLPQSNDTVVLNYGRNALSSVSATALRPAHKYKLIGPNIVNMPEMQMMNRNVSSISLPSQDLAKNTMFYSQATTSRNIKPKPSPCPIKLVDMKKLLKKPPVENEETVSSIHCKIKERSDLKSDQREIKGRKLSTRQKNLENPNLSLNTVENPNTEYTKGKPFEVKVSHVLDCLRVILPRTFDLSRLKPSEKVASLVIKYLKLVNNKFVENQVKVNLKIIIDAAKLEEKTFGDDLLHPYHKISDIALSVALGRTFPDKFTASEVSNEKLKCLCVLLSQDVYVDGFNILRGKIHKYTCEGNATSKRKAVRGNVAVSVNPKAGLDRLNETQRNVNRCKQTLSKSADVVPEVKVKEANPLQIGNNKIDNIGRNIGNDTTVSLNEENETNSNQINTDDKKAKLTTNLKLIINYLNLKKYSAKYVLCKEKTMVNLCKYLHIKSRKSNLLRLKKMLLFIVQKNLTKCNMGMIEETIDRAIQGKNSSKEDETEMDRNTSLEICSYPAKIKEVKQDFIPTRKKTESKNKLKLRPVVVVRDLVDYSSDQLLFMGERLKYRPSRYHNKRVPLSFTHINSLQKYSSDHVRKLTKESYTEFRRIVMKKDGEKVVFRLNYKRLNPGSSVFVKNFMCPSSGWLKGTISKMSGPLRYIVQLDDGETWNCVPEQLRPLPEIEHCAGVTFRSQRNVKPKKLFDL